MCLYYFFYNLKDIPNNASLLAINFHEKFNHYMPGDVQVYAMKFCNQSIKDEQNKWVALNLKCIDRLENTDFENKSCCIGDQNTYEVTALYRFNICVWIIKLKNVHLTEKECLFHLLDYLNKR